MFIAVDEPIAGAAVTASGFAVRGWLWLDAAHADLAAVEVFSCNTVVGETSRLYPRPDVAAHLGLPAEIGIGFHVTARADALADQPSFAMEVRARFRDGTCTHVLARVQLTATPAEADPLRDLRSRLAANACGLEIGAHAQAVPGVTPFYTDAVAAFAGTAGRADFLADASALPLADDSLDYLCSSHVLEHLPDPLGALHEWHRVLRPGGWLYLVVPDKRLTFDAPRPLTSVRHLLADFLHARTATGSAEHIDEFVFQTNWEKLHPEWPVEERAQRQTAAARAYREALRAAKSIDIHFHTFTPESLQLTLVAARLLGGSSSAFEISSRAERFPPARGDGFGLLLRKNSRERERERERETVDTFRLAHEDRAIAPLPLVCPVTLAPLREENAAADGRRLTASSGQFRYIFERDCPNLLPPPFTTPKRSWRRRLFRSMRYVTARWRLVRGGAA
jgi:SAM-dependent methyltransferase